MALMQITVIPLGTGTPGVGEHIATVLRALRSWDVPCTLTDMGTIIAGEPEELFALATQIHRLVMDQGLERVVTQVQIDDRRDKEVALGDKQRAVLHRLGGEGG